MRWCCKTLARAVCSSKKAKKKILIKFDYSIRFNFEHKIQLNTNHLNFVHDFMCHAAEINKLHDTHWLEIGHTIEANKRPLVWCVQYICVYALCNACERGGDHPQTEYILLNIFLFFSFSNWIYYSIITFCSTHPWWDMDAHIGRFQWIRQRAAALPKSAKYSVRYWYWWVKSFNWSICVRETKIKN